MYVSVEDPDERALALEDPRGFLGRFARGAILDEVQRAPELFESLLVSEWLKHRFNRALPANAFFWRDNVGNEIDLLLDHGRSLQPVEMTSGQTPSGDYFAALRKWLASAGPRARRPAVVYGGSRSMARDGVQLLAWNEWPEGAAGRSATARRSAR